MDVMNNKLWLIGGFIVVWFGLISSLTVNAQITENLWISTQIGIEEIDKRLFNYPEVPRQRIINDNPQNWATWTFGFALNKRVIDGSGLNLHVGIGYLGELNTFPRPYIPYYGVKGPRPMPSTFNNGYLMSSLAFPIHVSHSLFRGLSVQAQVLPSVSFHRWVPRGFPVNHWHLDWQALQINPGIRYTFDQFYVGAMFRAYHLRKVDRMFFSKQKLRIPENDPILKGYETLNMKKIWIEFGYKWQTQKALQDKKSKLE